MYTASITARCVVSPSRDSMGFIEHDVGEDKVHNALIAGSYLIRKYSADADCIQTPQEQRRKRELVQRLIEYVTNART